MVLLAGCSVSGNLTIPAERVAEQAASALQEQTGNPEPPEVDCGDDSVDLKDGEVVDCVLTDPTNGTDYATTVTLSNVDGTNFDIDVQVADTPLSGGESIEPETPGALTVPSSDLAALAQQALAPQLDYEPTVNCSEADVPVEVEQELRCMISGGASAQTVLITITEVDGTDYSINAAIQ